MTGGYFELDAIDNTAAQRFRALADRTIVAHPNHYPYRAIGQVVVEFSDGRRLQEPGTLLSDFTVLTAGHLVKHDNNTFKDISKLYFIPAKNHLSVPYGIYDWRHMRAVNAGARNWALLSLVEPAGHSVGYFGAYAQLPTEQWVGTSGLSHFSTPDLLTDELHIDEDVQITKTRQGRRLVTDQLATAGQLGGPLIRNWFSNNPQVVATEVAEAREFAPGWEIEKQDSWMTWLCSDFGSRNSMDRFQGSRSTVSDKGHPKVATFAMQPDYSPFSYYARDDGPTVHYATSNQRVEEFRACLIKQ